jgi:cysteine desulfurase / selenocysteine lyase
MAQKNWSVSMIERFDIAAVRREFPVTQRMLYLDSAHQTPLAASVRAALESFYVEGHEYAGPKPLWLKRVEEIRARVGRLIGAETSEIAFTKNTSEGLNIAANAIPFKAGDNVLMVEGDHPNNAYAFLNLRRKGVEVRFVPLKGETADADTFAEHIDKSTRAISLSHVTFHAGHRFDINVIGKLAKAKGLYLVVDAMQSIGVVPIDVKSSSISLMAFGCHKGLYVPQGLGVLYARKDLTELQPVYLAAASLAEPPADFIARPDNMGLREGAGRFEIGNFNIPDIHALAASLDLIERIGVNNISEHLLDLGEHLILRLDQLGVRLVGPRDRAKRAHIYVLDLPGAGWPEYFASENVRISPERDGIRISLGFFNTIEEIDRVVEIIRRRGVSCHSISR